MYSLLVLLDPWDLDYVIALLPVQYNYKQIYHDMVEPRGDDFVESLRVD